MEIDQTDNGFAPPDWVPDAITQHITVVPAEHVALHLLDLPIKSARQRRAALRFALEEAVGSPLDTLHFAICETHKDRKLLAAVIDRDVMQAAIASQPDVPVVAEQFLRAPTDGSEWATHRHGNRVLARLRDGTGFAAQIDAFETLWHLAGQPDIANTGDALPEPFGATVEMAKEWPTKSHLTQYDLRQGSYAPALGLERPLKWLAASVALAVVAHLGLAMADVRAQGAVADNLRQHAATVLQARFPAASPEDDPALVRRQIMAKSAPTSGSAFLPLMNNVSTAWLRDGSGINIRQLNWSNDGLRLVIEAPSLESLQGAEASLLRAGLSVSSGSATADGGSARAEFVVRQ